MPESVASRDRQVSDRVLVSAPAEEVWRLIADPTRIPEWSPENIGARTPHDGPLRAGDRFVGHNRRGPARWSTQCIVSMSVPGERFAFRVRRIGFGPFMVPVPIATWDFHLVAKDQGTLVTQTWIDDRPLRSITPVAFDRIATGGLSFAEFQRRNIRRSLRQLAERFEVSDDTG